MAWALATYNALDACHGLLPVEDLAAVRAPEASRYFRFATSPHTLLRSARGQFHGLPCPVEIVGREADCLTFGRASIL